MRGEGPRAAPHLPPGRKSSSRSQPASLGTCYHCGEPHGGVNEEFWGLGCPPLDLPKSDRHVGGAQDYEGEPEHLGRQAWIRLVG